MIHDDFFNFDFNSLSEYLCKHPNNDPVISGASKICKLLDVLLKGFEGRDTQTGEIINTSEYEGSEDFASFYFNNSDFDDSDELWETAKDFLHQGFLNLPYNKNLFIIKDGVEGGGDSLIVALKTTPETIEFFNSFINAFSNASELKIEESSMIFLDIYDAKQQFMPSPIVGSVFRNVTGRLWGGISFADSKSSKDMENNLSVACYKILQSCLIMDTKYVERVDHVISEKLNKKRERKGRSLLRNYSEIKIGKQYKENDASTGTHASPRPHWRRGHTRTLKSGKKVAVKPFIVNFKGDIIPPKGVYKL